MAKDLLTEITDERTNKNAAFPDLVREAEARRKLARKLAALREKRALSQTVVSDDDEDHFEPRMRAFASDQPLSTQNRVARPPLTARTSRCPLSTWLPRAATAVARDTAFGA